MIYSDYDILNMFNLKLNTKYKSIYNVSFVFEFKECVGGVVVCQMTTKNEAFIKPLNSTPIRILRGLREVEE